MDVVASAVFGEDESDDEGEGEGGGDQDEGGDSE